MNQVTDTPLDTPAGLKWDNRFARLGPAFLTKLTPTPLRSPYWVSRNLAMARELGLDPAWFESQA
eukprot:gene3891-4853_t